MYNKNKEFNKQALSFMVLGVIYFFLFSGLQNDHMNVLTPYLLKTKGWTDLQITNPATAGAVMATAVYLIGGIAFLKIGIKKVLVVCLCLMGLSAIGIGVSGDNYLLYCISLFVLRVIGVPIQLGAFALCANWFVKYRGRVMGIITIGAPIFSIGGIAVLTDMVDQFGLQAYAIVGVGVLFVALATMFGVADKPELMGLFPDGSDKAPISATDEIINIPFREFIRDINAWKIMIAFGTLQFSIICMMSYMAVRFISLSTPEDIPNLFVSKALLWLSVGAVSGIPMSFVLGWIDDKFGTIKASIVLTITYLFAVVPLMIMPVGGSEILMAVWAFGVACMTGGLLTLDPCITSYVYGRQKYMSANKWKFTIQSIPAAFAIAFMATFNQNGDLTTAYAVILCLLILPLGIFMSMLGLRDANEADRDYAKSSLEKESGLCLK